MQAYGKRRGAEVKTLNRIVTVLLVEAIILCLIASYFLVDNFRPVFEYQSTATLVIFNVLFFSLMYYLDGSLNRKLGLLALGNVLGVCWNFIFNYLDIAGSHSFGGAFNNLCGFFFPFLSSLWIISFWSLSLTILHHENSAHRKFPL